MTSQAPAAPASAPDTHNDVQSERLEENPAYRAAKGAMPPTCSLKPEKLRDRYSQPATAASKASTMPRCKRVPGKTIGSRKPSEKSRDCGKPKPSGRSEEHTSELQSLMRISYA